MTDLATVVLYSLAVAVGLLALVLGEEVMLAVTIVEEEVLMSRKCESMLSENIGTQVGWGRGITIRDRYFTSGSSINIARVSV